MIVRIYDFLSAEKPKFSENLVGIVSDVTKFKYTRRAYDIGSFEMEIPTHADESGYIRPDRMLIVGEKLSESYISGDPTRRIVNGTFLYVTEVDKNDQTITVTGYDLKYLFASRVTLFPAEEQDKGTYGYYVVSGTTFSCISNLINYNIVNATDSDRQIFGMSAITMPTTQVEAGLTGIQDDRYMTRLEPLSTAIFNLLKNCKTHFYDMRLIIDDNAEDSDNYNPHMESSEDKPTIIIDESRYNIKSYTRKDGTSAYKNAIYAVVGSGDDVTVKCVKRPNDTASGVKRKEVVLDVDTDSVAEIDRYAIKAAEDYNISDDFEIEPLFDDDDAEPTLAQKVLIRIDGVDYETVITEITDEYSGGKHTQSYVCGDKKLKVLNVLNKAAASNTQKIINNKIDISNKGGVGKTCGNGTSEQFNDYSTANIDEITRYSHIVGRNNTITGGDYDTIIGKGNTIKNVLSNSEKGYHGTRYGQGSVVTGTSNTTVQSVNTLVSGSNNYVGRSYWNPATDSMVIGSGNKVYGGMSSSAVIGYNNETPSSEYIDVISLSGSLIAGIDNQVKRGDVYSSFIIGNENKADLSDVYTALKIKKSMSQSVMIGTSNTNECVQGAYTIGHFNHQYSYTSESTTGKGQFAIGVGLKNGMPNNFVMGYYNKKYENGRELNLPFSFGYGTSDDDRKNLIELDEAGNLWIAGSLTEGSGGGGGYSLPAATSTTLGGVKIGDNIAVAADGTISVDLSSYLQSADISDWAKQPDKPVYTADEVGAAAEQHKHSTADITDFPAIPTKVSELQNDSGYISEETDPTVPAWAKADTKPTYTAEEVGAAEAVHTHAQSDITGLLTALSGKADTDHTHSEYAASNHTHSGYADSSHTHSQEDITGLASALASKANTSHTHTKSDITDFPTSMKNPNALTVQFNGTTNQTYDGSAAKTVNITPAGIGAATAEDITTAIDAVNIGARNIATGTASMTVGAINSALWSNGQWRYSGTGSIATIDITDSPVPSISKGIRVTSSAANKQIGIVQDKIPLNSNNIYTLSCWVRGSAASGLKCKLQPFYASSTDTGGALEINITDQWQFVSYTTVRSPQNTAEYSAAYIYLISAAIGDTMDICGVKLERGNKATDWCPAPEDLAIVSIAAENPSEGILTYIPFCKGVSNGTNLLINNGVRYNTKEGTTTSDGYAEFILGNNIPTGTAGNKFSALRMYGHNDRYESFRPYERTGNATKYLVGTSSAVSVGDTDTPVYINSDGVITPTDYKFSDFMLASGKGAISEEHSFWSGTSSHTFNYVTGRNRAFIVAWMDDTKATYMGFNLIYAATTVNTTSAVRLAYNGTVSMSYNIANGNITIGGGAGGYACRCAVIWFTV